ncbi:MAG: hypothetical protein AVDCRST_MAG93-4659 [uncultured Chloroflexia bacterium]|uniref:Uncharacterized protein n=1 Tax=uncultured Chloroflexia bacterium TaxID=1672391 RepID=A0A6J4KCZ5_9CHLR|nr:MAG: hypothetical protein AVDCRST_MAG93-4659 [uncultured Chloroflexia bacterium]
MRLVTRALSVKGTSREEREEIHQLLGGMEADHDGDD